jgi:D-alanyl-D-alanine carboxypeptidase/D-alanyl-D-alanine-endopeptidase (penicillin-binding protein 4)
MPARTSSRPRALVLAATVLLVLVASVVPAAAQAPTSGAPATPPGTGPAAQKLTTPVLSARRVPNLLRSRIADAELAAALQPVVDETPATSCISVTSTGREVFEHNETLPVEPASTNKILTSYAILQQADAQERLATIAVTSAPMDGGVVRGDLWLVGGGDGMLNTSGYRLSFEDPNQPVNDPAVLADRIKAAGVTEITGNVVGDDSRYDDQRAVATWPARYRADNTVGSLSALMVNHGLDGYEDAPEVATNARSPGDPPLLAAETLETLLEARGVRVGGTATVGRAPDQATEVARLESAPIGDIVAETLSWSDNTVAELLTKELGVRTSGSGTTAAGTKATHDALLAGGFPTEGLVINDGSGLDVDNRLTCDLLTEVLDAEGPSSVIGQGMAITGQRGTLRKRMKGSEVDGKVLAKTGTLTTPPVLALAGWVTTRSGEVVTFAYIQNGNGSDLRNQDALAAALYEYPQAPTTAVLGPKPPTPV